MSRSMNPTPDVLASHNRRFRGTDVDGHRAHRRLHIDRFPSLTGLLLGNSYHPSEPRDVLHRGWRAPGTHIDRHRRRGLTLHSASHPVTYLVTEPGITPLRTGQPLTQHALDEAEDRFGASSFTVRPVGDILDDWLTAPIAKHAPIDALARLIVLEVLLSANAPRFAVDERVAAETDGATVADLCRQSVAHIERLGRLREAGAPEFVRRTERRMLRATVRDLLAAVAAKFPPG